MLRQQCCLVTLLVGLNQSASQTLLGFVRQGGGGDELKQGNGLDEALYLL